MNKQYLRTDNTAKRIVKVEFVRETDDKTMEAYNAGEWCMLYVQARAVISINGVQQRVTSGGLGGVQSDSDEAYFKELQEEQDKELAAILAELGFDGAAVAKAFDERKDS